LDFFGGHDITRKIDRADHWSLAVDTAGSTWVSRAPMPTPLNHLAAAVLNGIVYSVGGQVGFESDGVMSGALQAYNPATNSWAVRASLVPTRSHTQSSAFVLDGRIVIAGGMLNDFSATTDVSAYDPAANTWVKLTMLPGERRSGVAGALYDHRWIYSGGTVADGFLASPST
ncbi:MAG: hypothetical protein ABIM89_12050, partial [Mycobacteriales bacterium]